MANKELPPPSIIHEGEQYLNIRALTIAAKFKPVVDNCIILARGKMATQAPFYEVIVCMLLLFSEQAAQAFPPADMDEKAVMDLLNEITRASNEENLGAK